MTYFNVFIATHVLFIAFVRSNKIYPTLWEYLLIILYIRLIPLIWHMKGYIRCIFTICCAREFSRFVNFIQRSKLVKTIMLTQQMQHGLIKALLVFCRNGVKLGIALHIKKIHGIPCNTTFGPGWIYCIKYSCKFGVSVCKITMQNVNVTFILNVEYKRAGVVS